MRSRSLRTTLLLAVTATFAVSCAPNDNLVAPSGAVQAPSKPSKDLLGLLATPTTVTALQRTTPLAQPITRSAYIGVLGGVLSLPGAGLTVVVPPLALTSTKLISVTALAGSNVAYTFSPHGTQFLVPVVATQSLVNTEAARGGSINPLSLFVGYFPDDNNIFSVTDILQLNINLLSQTAVMTLPHFSGYIVATGYGSDSGY
jgi:hypothetical protein